MLIFDRANNQTPMTFADRQVQENKVSKIEEANYYQHLANKFESSSCLAYAHQLIKEV